MNGNPTFERVRAIIADQMGVKRDRITMDADLAGDLGVDGDDGVELFEALDDAFTVDWTGLDLGVHFGGEGWGLPLPWRLKDHCAMFETQPCTVADVVRAVDSGRWHGSRRIPRPRVERTVVYLMSTLQLLLLGLLLGLAAAVLLGKAARWAFG